MLKFGIGVKKSALLITLLLVAAAAAYLLYDKYYQQEPTSLWQLVPANAISVYESSRTATSWERLHETVMWPSLNSLKAISELDKQLQAIDTISGQAGGLDQLLGSPFLITTHVVKKNAFDQLFLVDLSKIESQQIISTLLSRYEKDSLVKRRTRTYQEMQINELQKGESVFSYLIHDNKLIASYTPFLVEDVIRRIADPEVEGFASENANVLAMPKLAQDDGNLYINVNNMGEFMAAFSSPDHVMEAREISRFARNAFLDIKIENNRVFFNGFTNSGEDGKFLHTLSDQVPVKIDFKFRVPVNTAIFLHFSFSDASAWHRRAMTFWETEEKSFVDERTEQFGLLNFEIENFYNGIGSSVSLMKLEVPGSIGFIPVAMAETRDTNGVMSMLNRLGESIARAEGDSTYVERYDTFEIRELVIDEFPRQLFGPMFSGFDRTYYAFDNSVLYLAPDLVTLKEVLSSVQSENTWGRSVLYNQFVDDLLKEANLTMVVNNRKAWENLLSKSDPKWENFARDNAGMLKNFGLMAFQFSKLDDYFYTSISLLHDGKNVEIVRQPQVDIKMRAMATYPIVTKPYVVRNHTNNLLETVIQDSANYFHLVGTSGEIVWSKQLNSRLTSDVTQVDFYQNGKLQYFFTTENAIHIIDRLGNYVEGYPVSLTHKARHATVVDYDNSRRYRWLIADEFGNLYLYNKTGVVLEGWSPRTTGGRLSSDPFHLRIRGRDCLVAIEGSGKIHVMNRRGEYYPGFPLDLGVRIETKPFVQPGANFSETLLTVIDKDGKLVTVNLAARVLRSEQLYKPTTDTEFQLIPDMLGKTYIIARYDRRRLVLLNRNQEELMSKDYLEGNGLDVQYYDFGSDVQVYAVADAAQGFTFLYGNEGKMLGARPLDSGKEIALLYSELNKVFTIYYVSGKQVVVQAF
ncbi:hypothetical protein [Fulvivirga sedimenti]|uniref:DUF3352 domain-containing protein n=1 Tax=Fulvivirga sedimenti TaxID=2879465 RepID=A0A9X1L397_9BACT|nr:hypothetical protein [Fulvivirga sedimenti]MCA6079066.1 hypothetical protein [Fulvivirga sedimenti]